jgi:hypothetical protein
LVVEVVEHGRVGIDLFHLANELVSGESSNCA